MCDLNTFVFISLLPLLLLIAMVDLGIYIFKHRLITLMAYLSYVAVLAYYYMQTNLNPIIEASFWASSLFMVFTLYQGWEIGKKQVQCHVKNV